MCESAAGEYYCPLPSAEELLEVRNASDRTGAAEPGGSPQLFLLFTQPRSGSTYTGQVLDAQPDVFSRGEMGPYGERMHRFAHKSVGANATWEIYSKALSQAFNLMTPEATASSKNIMGFKMLYGDIPRHLVNDFLKWAVVKQVKILHLERGAVLNRIESGETAIALKAQGVQGHHNVRASDANLTVYKHRPIEVSRKAIRPQITREEDESDLWARLFQKRGIAYYHVFYETLLGQRRNEQLRQMMKFLSNSNGITFEDVEARLGEKAWIQLHKPSCRGRIAHYEEVRRELACTRTAIICDALDLLV
jgi:LPS sulfotransferase NodH